MSLNRDGRFDGERKAGKSAEPDPARLCAHSLCIEVDDGVQEWVDAFDLAYIFVRQFEGRDLTLLKQCKLGDG